MVEDDEADVAGECGVPAGGTDGVVSQPLPDAGVVEEVTAAEAEWLVPLAVRLHTDGTPAGRHFCGSIRHMMVDQKL